MAVYADPDRDAPFVSETSASVHIGPAQLEEEPAVKESELAAELVDIIVSESSDLGRMVEDLLTQLLAAVAFAILGFRRFELRFGD